MFHIHTTNLWPTCMTTPHISIKWHECINLVVWIVVCMAAVDRLTRWSPPGWWGCLREAAGWSDAGRVWRWCTVQSGRVVPLGKLFDLWAEIKSSKLQRILKIAYRHDRCIAKIVTLPHFRRLIPHPGDNLCMTVFINYFP